MATHLPLRAFAVPVCLLILAVPACRAQQPAASPAVHRGDLLFATRGCAHCHGVNGVGPGIGPDLAHVRDRLTPARIAAQIRDGGKSMPAFGDILSSREVQDLVDYLRSQRQAAPPATPNP